MGYPHHIQSPMGGSSIDPKFPPNTEEYQHLHNGYGIDHHNGSNGSMPSGMSQTNPSDYGMPNHQSNGIHHNVNNYNYSQVINGHYYHHHHHHHGYNSPMHSMSNSSYSPSAMTTHNGGGYYNGYYGQNNSMNGSPGIVNSHHQAMDLPLQCPSAEPTNTALGLQELGTR